MQKTYIFSFVFVLTFTLITSNQLLNLLHLCERHDANFEKCVIDETNRLVKVLANGVENYYPNILPYKFSNITYENDFSIDLYEGSLKGLDTFKANVVKFLWDDNKMFINGVFDKLELQSTCKIVGNIREKSVNGIGSINVILENIDFNGDAYFYFTRKQEDKFVKYMDNKIFINPQKIEFNFSKIFADEAEGKKFNEYLMANVATVKAELLPVVEEVIKNFFMNFQSKFGKDIPFNHFFKNYYN